MQRTTRSRCTRSTASSSSSTRCARSPTRWPRRRPPTTVARQPASTPCVPTSSLPARWCWKASQTSTRSSASSSARQRCAKACCSTPSPACRAARSHHLRDVSRRSIRALAERCDDDLTHSVHVATLALQLFDATESLHGLGTDAREYLEAGALLANVGLVISHSKHHLHSYYVIRNSELTGLTDTEIEIIAQIARYHRKSAPKASHAEFGRLAPEHQRLVKTLAGILRVAIRSRSQPRRTGAFGDGPAPQGSCGDRGAGQTRQGDQPRAVHRQRAERTARRGARSAGRHCGRAVADRLSHSSLA